jgi:DNA-binding ferritin-like protein
MKCPFTLEPHQIQGLDFINIHPVIQWLVKESVNLRAEKAEKLKLFSVGEFHNHFKLITSDKTRQERLRVLQLVKEINSLYSVKRIFKRKHNAEPDDEKSRVRLTLLEYGIRNIVKNLARATEEKALSSEKNSSTHDDVECDEVKKENLISLHDSTNPYTYTFLFLSLPCVD